MKTYAVYLWPRGSLSSDLGSDTLFGAVCWGLKVLGLADIDQLLEAFDPPRFAFSSAFPVYRHNGATVRFYPRPVWLELNPAQEETLAGEERHSNPALTAKAARMKVRDRAKRLHEVAYLSEELFAQAAQGHLDAADLLRQRKAAGGSATGAELEDRLLVTPAERERVVAHNGRLPRLMQQSAAQHNQIDRVAGATVEGLLFYANETYFAGGAGLWCLLRTTPEDLDGLIRPALRYLADTGLGGNRTAGKGHFDIEVADTPPLPDAGTAANGWVTLSRYLPLAGEWDKTARPLGYRLANLWAKREKRYATAGVTGPEPIYKRRLRLFEPGSVFPLGQRKDIYGRLALVVPQGEANWAVYQSGLALGVPVRAPVEGG
jgi:CRISPR-associated protein Csm4